VFLAVSLQLLDFRGRKSDTASQVAAKECFFLSKGQNRAGLISGSGFGAGGWHLRLAASAAH
jgi:hypothetical protein